MLPILLTCLCLLLGAATAVLVFYVYRQRRLSAAPVQTLQQQLEQHTRELRSEFALNRQEYTRSAQSNRQEQAQLLEQHFRQLSQNLSQQLQSFRELQQQQFGQLAEKQQALIQHTESRLEQIRHTVAEKLDKTLGERLQQSFASVGRQLVAVQQGLGEMQALAQDVGGLKRVLSNVKMRGSFGEIQLSLLLEQLLAPEQYQANVITRTGSTEHVEFAIKLPGRDPDREQVWLPVDAKFPRDAYEELQQAYDQGQPALMDQAQKKLETAIRRMAADISGKYINPPATTDFAIMFLPFEGIYAEVVRKASLLEELQRRYKVIVTGPSTFAAMLNSLQMGFKTLAIQQRSSEVWAVLSGVKKEFDNFSGLMQKAQNNIQTGLNQLDDVLGKRTRAIQRQLSHVAAMQQPDSAALPGEDPVTPG